MASQFKVDTLKTVRQRLGKMMLRNRYLVGLVVSETSSTVVVDEAKLHPDGTFIGRTFRALETGAERLITGSVQGTGTLTVAPNWSPNPDPGDTYEIWPEGFTVSYVNNAIAAAVLEAQVICPVFETITSPTIDSTRRIITPPAGWNKVVDLTWVDASGNLYSATGVHSVDDFKLLHPNTYRFSVVNGTLRLSWALDSAITGPNTTLRGYRLPTIPSADSDNIEVRSDFVMYRAAAMLEASGVAQQGLDPEASGARASLWNAQADRIRAQMDPKYRPNTWEIV